MFQTLKSYGIMIDTHGRFEMTRIVCILLIVKHNCVHNFGTLIWFSHPKQEEKCFSKLLTSILQPYSRVNTENPYPILDLFPDLLMLTGLRKVVVLPAVPIFTCHLPGNFLRLNLSSNSLVLWKMIPYSRPKLSDFYTLF